MPGATRATYSFQDSEGTYAAPEYPLGLSSGVQLYSSYGVHIASCRFVCLNITRCTAEMLAGSFAICKPCVTLHLR